MACDVGAFELQEHTDSDDDGYFLYASNDSHLDCNDASAISFPGAEEICDGLDNDCDGSSDEDFTNLDDTCSVGTGECAASGRMICTSDGTNTECDASAGTPTEEICDGLDNDCDGSSDEDFTNLGDVCTVGVGACQTTGTLVCSEDTTTTECDAIVGSAGNEICDDNIDNDCDGDADNSDTDCQPTPSSTSASSGGCQLNPSVPNYNQFLTIATATLLFASYWSIRKMKNHE